MSARTWATKLKALRIFYPVATAHRISWFNGGKGRYLIHLCLLAPNAPSNWTPDCSYQESDSDCWPEVNDTVTKEFSGTFQIDFIHYLTFQIISDPSPSSGWIPPRYFLNYWCCLFVSLERQNTTCHCSTTCPWTQRQHCGSRKPNLVCCR